MDALKKAEQEKKEAAKRLEQAADLARLERTGEHPAQITGEHETLPVSTAPEPVVSGSSPGPSPALSLEPLVPGASAATPPPAVEPASGALAASEEPTLNVSVAELKIDLSGTESHPGDKTAPQEVARQGAAPDLDQTFHGVAIAEEAAPGLYEETIQGEQFEPGEPPKVYEETLPGIPAIQLAKDLGGEGQPTPVAAQTVFTAGESKRQPSSGLKWAYVGLPLIAVVAGLAWYYYTVTPVNRQLPSPWVARGIESIVPVPAGPLSEAPLTGVAVSGAAKTPAVPSEAAAPVPELPAVPIAGESPTQPAATAPAPESVAATTGMEQEERQAEAVSAPAVSGQPAAPPLEGGAPTAPEVAQGTPVLFGTPPSLIKIRRVQAPSDDGLLIQQAFADYQSGDVEAARNGYLEVLTRIPDSADALLGLGAIAMKERNRVKAVEIYLRILRLDPRNETARAALIGLQKETDLLASESALKLMVGDFPDNPYLYFTLGTIYAAQRRWAEAQLAFFDAYRNDSTNPDYALNLAVSLDRLGQSATALDYYNVAIKLSDDRPAGFDTSGVLARIQSLSRSQNP